MKNIIITILLITTMVLMYLYLTQPEKSGFCFVEYEMRAYPMYTNTKERGGYITHPGSSNLPVGTYCWNIAVSKGFI